MNASTARALFVGLLVAVWFWLTGQARLRIEIWPGIVALGCYFAAGGGVSGLQKTVIGTLSGVVWVLVADAVRVAVGGTSIVAALIAGGMAVGIILVARVPFLGFVAGAFPGGDPGRHLPRRRRVARLPRRAVGRRRRGAPRVGQTVPVRTTGVGMLPTPVSRPYLFSSLPRGASSDAHGDERSTVSHRQVQSGDESDGGGARDLHRPGRRRAGTLSPRGYGSHAGTVRHALPRRRLDRAAGGASCARQSHERVSAVQVRPDRGFARHQDVRGKGLGEDA